MFEWNKPFVDNSRQWYNMKTHKHNETLSDMYFKKMDESVKDQVQNTFNEDNLKGCGVDMMTAGNGTVAETLKVTLLYLIMNSDVQEKMFSEIFALIGRDPPTLKDRKKLPYVQAVILEGIRILHVAPLALPHSVLNDTEFCGYKIPKNCTILLNLESIMKDPNLWDSPKEFKPERFLNAEQTDISVPKEFIPFSKGPRSCIGETVARMELFFILTILVQTFKFLPAMDGEVLECRTKF